MALIQRKPVIRSAYWRLHQILEELLAPIAANAGYQLVPAFGTRLSCIVDPQGLVDIDQQFVKSKPLEYLLLALPAATSSRASDSDGVPIPLIGIDLTDQSMAGDGFERTMRRFMPRYLRLSVEALERARELVQQALPSFADDVTVALSKNGTSAVDRANEARRDREFMHGQERALFRALVQHVGRHGLYVVGQVGLSDVIDIHGAGFRQWLKSQPDDGAAGRRVASWVKKHPVDFVICSPPPVSLPLVLIEYDGMRKRQKDPGLADAMHRQLVELAEQSELQLCRLRVDRTKGWIWSDAHFEDALTPVAMQARVTVLDPEFQGAVIGAMESTIDALTGPRLGRSARGQRLAEDHACLVSMLVTRTTHLEGQLRQIRESAGDACSPPSDALEAQMEEHWQQTREIYELMESEDAMESWKARNMAGPPPRVVLGLEREGSLEGESTDLRIKVVVQSGARLAKAGKVVREVGSAPLMMMAYGHRREAVLSGYIANIKNRIEDTLLHRLRSRADELHEAYRGTF